MLMVELNDLLPSSQWEENWTFYGSEHEGFPQGTEYVVFEFYCDNPECDCKLLTACVMKLGFDGEPIRKPLAVIHYDWSTPEAQCHPRLDEEPPPTELALSILEVYKKFVHHPDYIARIKSHYTHVKQLVSEKKFSTQKNPHNKLLSRNAPCPCGSHRKYKKCCLKTGLSQVMQ